MRKQERQTAKIPQGGYCYRIVKIVEPAKSADEKPRIVTKKCPYLRIRRDAEGDAYGHCRFLRRGDQSRHNPTMLLFDGVKECDVKNDQD